MLICKVQIRVSVVPCLQLGGTNGYYLQDSGDNHDRYVRHYADDARCNESDVKNRVCLDMIH